VTSWELTFFVEGNPVPKQSFKKGKKGGYTPARVKAWQDLVSTRAKNTMALFNVDMLLGDVEVELILWRGDRKKVDIDNLSKAILDGCNDIVWKDDEQVVKITICKRYNKEEPGAMVMVRQVEDWARLT
jgi:Holliday junction resolvase RusA-like endonuclease